MKSKQDYLRMLFGEPKAREENSVLDRIQSTLPLSKQFKYFKFSVDDLINQQNIFYSNKQRNNKHIGNAVALEEAYTQLGDEGIIASMPYLIAGKAESEKDNYLWQDWFTALSEENVGIDTKGNFVKKGKPVVITVHGGGILTPERIFQAYGDGLTSQNSAKYTNEEFEQLLNGKINGESIEIYSIDDVMKGNIKNPFGKYAIVLDFDVAKNTKSDYFDKKDFMKNPLVLARAGTLEYLDVYFEKAKHSDGTVGNSHRLNDIDPKQPQGRVLYLNIDYNWLDGSISLDNDGRFVGVGVGDAKR
ncbi:MAG: hypothetical protein PHU51_02200 [Candidatus Nanoarchaeia archaeon]|nr:hypothetical protein [Candidatus Nanoarchaeia archaeon]